MFSTKKVKGSLKPTKNINLNLLLGLGFFIFIILIFLIFIGYNLENTHRSKIDKLKTAKLDLTIVHLQIEEKAVLVDTTFNNLHILEARQLVKNLLSSNWEDYFLPIAKPKQQKDIKAILQKINNFGTLLKSYKYTPEYKIKHDSLYSDLIMRIENLEEAVNNRCLKQIKIFRILQLFGLVIFTFYMAFVYFVVKRFSYLRKIFIKNQENRLELQRDLIRSKKNLLKLQEIAQLGSYNLNLTTKEFTSSAIFDKIVGLKLTDTKTFTVWRTITHPDDTPENQKMLDHCIKTGEKFDREYRIITKDTKEIKWLHDLGRVIYEEGLTTNFIGTIQDITERKLIELALKDSEHKLKEAQEITRLGTFIFDFDTNMFETSPICDDILGLEPSYNKDIFGWINLVHPDDYVNVRKLLDNSKLNTISKEFKIIRPKDKKITWILGKARKEFDIKGKRHLITGTIQDITERKKVEEKLRQSDAILNKINSLVIVSDKQANLIYVSPSVKQILGYNPEELLGQGWWNLTYSSAQEAKVVKKEVDRYVYNNGPKTDKVASRIIKTKEGTYKNIEWYISKGVGSTYISIGIDVTKTKEKDLQFKKLTETANAAITLVNAKGLIIEWNNAAVKLFGYTKDEILGKPIQLIIPEKYHKKHNKSFVKANKQGFLKESKIRRLEAINKDGKIFPIELSLNTWKSGGKQIFCGFINDISQREYEARIKEVIYDITKYAQNSLKLEHLLYFIRKSLNKVIDTSNFYVALYDSKSQTFNSPYRVDLEVADKYNYLHQFPKEKSFSGYVLDTKKPFLSTSSFEKALIKKGIVSEIGVKSKCWLGVPLTDKKDTIGVMVVQSYTNEKTFSQKDVVLLELVATNISQAIKQSQDYQQIQLLNQALIQSPEAVIVTNLKGEIEYVNPAFTVLSGYSEEEALGQNPRLLKSGDQSKKYYKKLWDTIISGKVWEGEFINKRKDGGKYLVAAKISAIKNREGIITHCIGVEGDITEKRKLERDFVHAFIDAQEQEKQSFGEELHDGISQILTAESMYIDILINQKKVGEKDKKKFRTYLYGL